MSIREKRRNAAINKMADHLLSQGLGAATLRPMAAAAGTSDRMLLYYFADRNEVLTATLHRISERMLAQLDLAIPASRPQDFHALLKKVYAVLKSKEIKPFMHLWLDLAAGAARGVEPHRRVAGEIADGFLAWVTTRLKVNQRSHQASLFLIAIEGMYLLEAIGRPGFSAAAAAKLSAILEDQR